MKIKESKVREHLLFSLGSMAVLEAVHEGVADIRNNVLKFVKEKSATDEDPTMDDLADYAMRLTVAFMELDAYLSDAVHTERKDQAAIIKRAIGIDLVEHEGALMLKGSFRDYGTKDPSDLDLEISIGAGAYGDAVH